MKPSKKQSQVAQLITVGLSDKEIGDELNIATRTVINHKTNIFEKLGISKSTERCLYIFCQEKGIPFNPREIRKKTLDSIKKGEKNIIAFLLACIAIMNVFNEEGETQFCRRTMYSKSYRYERTFKRTEL